MAKKCPKCQSDNPETSSFCPDCGTQLPSPKDIEVTETIEAPREELTRGTTLAGRYEIIEELGKGGMGRVYRVEDTKLKQEVALKLIKPEIASDKKTIERFRNELKTARMIAHKNVCRMFDLGESEGSHFITMEFVRGEDLKSMVRMSGQLGMGTAISIAKQVCEGLTEAHRLGVVHRDLKPSNLMIDKDGNARIMDFGIARSLEAKGITGAGVMIGTPEYMSPEQVEGKETDQRSDIYSLGVILYEMVTGQVPFEGDTPFTIGVKHKSEMPKNPKELNAQIPEDLSRVVMRCLEKDKEKRYQSAGEVRSELENIEKGIPTTERVTPKRTTITSREITVTLGMKKLLIPALIFLAVVIAGVIVWQILPQKEPVSAPKIENSIAVISFENQTGDKAYDYLQKAIPSLLITNLEQTGIFYVATWERLRDLLRQTGNADVDFIDNDLGFRLCRNEGIEAIVLGSFIKAGDMFAVDVKILDVETKKLLKSVSSRGVGPDSILKTQIDELSKEISEGVGVVRQKIEAQLKIADVTTTSMESYNYFLKGKENYINYYRADAIQFLERAVELNPTFASAYLYIALSHDYLGDIKARNEALRRAKSFSQRATEKERLYIEASYAEIIEQDEEKTLRILQQMAKKFPKEKRIWLNLGWYYQGRGNPQKAIEEHTKALELDPNYKEALNWIAYAYANAEDYEKAIDYFNRYVSVSPRDANPLDSIGDIYFVMGNLEDALSKFREAVKIKPDFHSSYTKIGYIFALKEDYSEAMKWIDQTIDMAPSTGVKVEGNMWKGFYHFWLGTVDKSFMDLQKAAGLAEASGDRFMMGEIERMKGMIHYERGELELSQQYLNNSLNMMGEDGREPGFYSKVFTSLGQGLIDLKKGLIDSVRSRLAEMKYALPELPKDQKTIITFYHDQLHAEILLAEDEPEKAVKVSKKMTPFRSPWLQYTDRMIFYNVISIWQDILARAYQEAGEIDAAIAEYERLIAFDPKGTRRQLVYPKHYYCLAKLFEQQNNNTKAIKHYEKFLKLWKDADPGTAEVEDARKRLAALKNH